MGCITSTNTQTNSLTLHFAGIRSPKSCKSTLKITDKVPVMTINSSLTTEDTIQNLKKLIHKTYKLSSNTDILILYSHTIISNDDELTLQDFGITNNSLLFLAIKTENDIHISSLTSITNTAPSENVLLSPRFEPQLFAPITIRNIMDNPPRRHHVRSRLNLRLLDIDDMKIEGSIDSISDSDSSSSSDSDTDISVDSIDHIQIRRINTTLPIINIDNDVPTTPLPTTRIRFNQAPVSPQPTQMLTVPTYSTIFSPIQRNRSPPPQLQPLPRRINYLRDESLSSDSLPELPRLSLAPVPDITRLHSTPVETIENNIICTSLSVPNMNPALTEMKVDSNSNNLSPTNSTHSDETVNTDTLSLQPIKGFDIIMQEENVLGYKMPKCRHFMNKDSLHQYALSIFSDRNNVILKCPHSLDENEQKYGEWSCVRCTFRNPMDRSNCEMCLVAKPDKNICDMQWDWSLIKKVLMTHKEKGAVSLEMEEDCIDKLTKLELLSARNKLEKECNVQKCPGCESLYCREDKYDKLFGQMSNASDLEKVFKTKCEICSDVSFCWGCGVQWTDAHFCDSSFRKELIEILKDAETKKIGEVEDVPSIRCCPNCCQLIYHSDACKHMQCKSCKTDFCFVCIKMKENGNWQCGSHSSVCTVAEKQNVKTLPDSVIINKKAFKLF